MSVQTVAPSFGIFPVTDSRYGAVGNGSTDDVAAIQAAIDAAQDAGGGIVFFPEGTYLLTDTDTNGAITSHLQVKGDHIHFVGAGKGSVIKSTTDAYMFHITGAAKPSGFASFADNQWVNDLTRYTIDAASQGATSITLSTAADAANFAAGHEIFIRTGQTLAGSALDQPDSEINEVISADSDTGVLVLRYPLTKDYAQEYYVSGTSGVTSTSVTANLAPLAVSNVSDTIARDIGFRHLNFVNTSTTNACIAGDQIDGISIRECFANYSSNFQSMSAYRDGWFVDNQVHIADTGDDKYAFSTAFGCSDVTVRDNVVSSERVAFMHVHEGSANVLVQGNRFYSTTSASDENSVSVRSRAYNIKILDNWFANSGVNNAIFVSEACVGGGEIRGNTFVGSFTNAYNVRGSGWKVGPNNLIDGVGRVTSSQFGNQASQTGIEVLQAWVEDDNQNVILGTLPVNAVVDDVIVDVQEAFNSDGTDLLTVGYDADTDFLATSLDVSSTGIYAISRGTLTAGVGARYVTTARSIEAYYVNGGSEPTTGKALISVLHHLAEAVP